MRPGLAGSDDGRGIKNRTVLIVQIGERHGMHLIGAAQPSVKIAACESETGIRHKIRLESQVPRHSDSRLNRVVGADSRNDQSLDS